MPILHEKVWENEIFLYFSGIFSCKIVIKSKDDNIFETIALDFMPLCIESMFQISARLNCKCESSSKIRKTSKNSIFAFFFIRNSS